MAMETPHVIHRLIVAASSLTFELIKLFAEAVEELCTCLGAVPTTPISGNFCPRFTSLR